jgi:hypothetical protein
VNDPVVDFLVGPRRLRSQDELERVQVEAGLDEMVDCATDLLKTLTPAQTVEVMAEKLFKREGTGQVSTIAAFAVLRLARAVRDA